MEAADALREELRAAGREPLPSYNDLVVRAVALALREFPALNASYDRRRTLRLRADQRRHRGRRRRRAARARRSTTPTVSPCSRSPREAARLAEAARARTLAPADLADGTFTVSNLGMLGVRRFHAVINAPQAAILAVGEVAPRAVADGTAARRADDDGGRALVRPPRRLRRRGGPLPAAPAPLLEHPVALVVDEGRDMTEIDFREAVRSALDEELERDERVILFGEDVALAGGVFATTPGLYEKYGPKRVFDTPISELAMTGAAYGAAITGLRPVLEIMFGDFLALSMDSLINQATKYWFLTGERTAARS